MSGQYLKIAIVAASFASMVLCNAQDPGTYSDSWTLLPYEIEKRHLNLDVELDGVVTAFEGPRKDSPGRKVTVSDGRKLVRIVIADEIWKDLPLKDSLRPGIVLKSRVKLQPGADEVVEGLLDNAANLVVQPSPLGDIVLPSDVDKRHLDKDVDVHGVMTTYEAPGPDNPARRITISDGRKYFRIAIGEDIWNELPFKDELAAGMRIKAKVRLQAGPSDTIEGHLATAANLTVLPPHLGDGLQLLTTNPKLEAPPKTVTRIQHHYDAYYVGAGLAAIGLLAAAWAWRRSGRAISVGEAERQKAEEAVKQGQARLMHLLSANSAVIYSLKPTEADPQGPFQLTFVSENLSQVLGYNPTESLSQSGWWPDSIHPEDRTRVQTAQQQLPRTGTVDIEYRFRHSSGEYFWVHDKQRLLRDSQGEPTEVVGTWMDVTEHKWAEKMKEVFASLGAKLSALTTPRDVAQVVLKTADALFNWDAAYVSLYSESDDSFHGILHFDQVNGKRKEVPPFTAPVTAVTRQVLSDGAQMVLREGDNPPSNDLQAFGEKTRRSVTLMFAPIRSGKKNIGLISIQSYAEKAYQQRDLQVLQVLANYCSAALERTFAEAQRQQAEEALRDSEERYALALRGANDGLWDWDLKADRIYFSPRWKAMVGFAEDEISDTSGELMDRIHPDDLQRVKNDLQNHLNGKTAQLEVQCRMRHKDETYRWMLIRGVAVRDESGTATRMAGSQTDVTQRRRAEEQLLHGAYYDALTGLPNRLLFTEQLRRALGRFKRRPSSIFAVLFLDLDRFKIINDSLGHLVGDKLLINVAGRLKGAVRPEDMVARLGGDEFTILLEDIVDSNQATRVAERIQLDLSSPVELDGNDVYSTVSIGIAFSSTSYEKPEDILRDADAAMYRAKAKGKARHELFDKEMHARAVAILQTETDLRRALERNELVVYYQPLVELSTRKVTGFEALVRWQHPERGLILPGEFIPIAEESGLIVQIGWWVLREACRQIQEWQSLRQLENLTVSVNFSRKQFAQPDLAQRITAVLDDTGLPPQCLALEITESTLMENAEHLVALLARLKGLGLQLHVDDFGTGYSSLAYLHRFPIDKLKIDRSFTNRMTPEGGNSEIVKAIINLAGSLGIGVVAEGIETVEHVAVLQGLDCKFGQGFLFSRPVNAHTAEAMLTESLDADVSNVRAM